MEEVRPKLSLEAGAGISQWAERKEDGWGCGQYYRPQGRGGEWLCLQWSKVAAA